MHMRADLSALRSANIRTAGITISPTQYGMTLKTITIEKANSAR